jgi:hypothetical protein
LGKYNYALTRNDSTDINHGIHLKSRKRAFEFKFKLRVMFNCSDTSV